MYVSLIFLFVYVSAYIEKKILSAAGRQDQEEEEETKERWEERKRIDAPASIDGLRQVRVCVYILSGTQGTKWETVVSTTPDHHHHHLFLFKKKKCKEQFFSFHRFKEKQTNRRRGNSFFNISSPSSLCIVCTKTQLIDPLVKQFARSNKHRAVPKSRGKFTSSSFYVIH